MFLFLLLVIFSFFSLPAEALAFGPGVHLELALKLLERFSELKGPLGFAFLYGNIAPDFFVSSAALKALFHTEKAYQKLLRKADNPFTSAFAQGFGTHLEADQFAHERLIPAFKRRLELPLRLIHYYFEWTLERNRASYWYFLRGILTWPGHRKLDQFLIRAFELDPRQLLTRKWVSFTGYRLFKIKRRLPPTNLAILFERRFQSTLPRCLGRMETLLTSLEDKRCEL
ncbi:MAG: zinc dependent phospholipase C family protein [Thermodesulfobacteria bacterium]|nr:zinc dependent phospholipase C family protein [Thermodesulfobacteriota bacterium]